jgi:hypothetical protein
VSGVTYDTGALIAADRADPRLWTIHRRALERGDMPIVPVGVLGQAWRGGPQPALSRVLRGCRIEELDEATARQAGTACARAGTNDVIDATVAIGAVVRGDRVVTSDPDDLRSIASAMGLPITIEAI